MLKEILNLIRRPTPSSAPRFYRLNKRCNPIEKVFWAAAYPALSELGQFTPQVAACGYRLDFALFVTKLKFAIEVNGFDHHATKEQQSADALRTRLLLGEGWCVIPFAAREVYLDADACVREVIRIVGSRQC